MDQILDILIKEVASVLGISREEVISRFTKEELDELLNNSLCTPMETFGAPFNDISTIPCAPPPPEFLPEADLGPIDEILKNAKPKEDPNKCLDSVKEVNKKVNEQTEKYNNYKILLEKLIEYRDNYIPIKYYFEEKSKEAARILGIFSPLLIERTRLAEAREVTRRRISSVRSQLFAATSDKNYELANRLQSNLSSLNGEINQITSGIDSINIQIKEQQDSIPIFNNSFFRDFIAIDASDPQFSFFLGALTSNFIDAATFRSIKSSIENYSETIQVGKSTRVPVNTQEALSNNYITFDIKFPNLEYLVLEKENYNESDGSSSIVKTNFNIKNSQLLEKNSFFKNSDKVSIAQFNKDRLPTGSLYTQYYNLFEDPINNFFQLSERGLTEDENAIDSRVRGTDAEKKKENGKQYFVQNIDVLQNFYQNFEEAFFSRTREVKEQRITPIQNRVKEIMNKLARQEIQFILAVGGVNKYIPAESQFLNTISARLQQEGEKYATGAKELDEEIARIQALLEELKPTPDNVKKLLKEANGDCFKDMDRPANPCPPVREKLGSDPFGIKTLKSGADATLPNQNQLCYWLEFSKLLNIVGLLPIPNLPNVLQLRYWPVGLVIPAPSGLIKIPLPIIYIPLIVISTPLGNLVFFLTVNGLFISPVVFFVSSSGFKQLIVTVKGSSEKFGYDKDDESIKLGIQTPVAISAALEKAKNKALELINGKYQHLSEEERSSLETSIRILKERIKRAEENGNEIERLKAELKLKKLEAAATNKGFFEKLEEFLNTEDSPNDFIDRFKKSINKSIAKIGQPSFRKSIEKKEKILSEREKQRKERRQALIDGNLEKVKDFKEKIKGEALDLQEKIKALEEDLLEIFDKIKFPKITIPKNKEAIDPKQNSIISFIEEVLDFSELYGTQLFSVEEKKIGKKFLKELARANDDINDFIVEKLNFETTIDLEEDIQKVKDILQGLVDTLIEKIAGKDTTDDIKKIQEEINQLKTQRAELTDRVEQKKIDRKIRRLNSKISSLNGDKLNYATNILNPTTLAGFDQLGIDFNPFSPCCGKSPFSLSIDTSAVTSILEIVKLLLNSIIQGFDKDQLSNLFGGKTKVSALEIKTGFTGIIKKIPEELILPIPSFDAVKFLEICSKLFLPLFEPKAPILAALPALPASIVIDLNILKEPLLKLLLEFFKSLIPDPKQDSIDQLLKSNQKDFTNTKSNLGNFDDSLKIESCDVGVPSSVRGPFSDVVSSSPKQNIIPKTDYSISNAYVVSKKSIFPAFQNISTRFIDINPEDLIALITTFFELTLDKVASLLEPFYTLLKIIKAARNTNLNVIEDAQNKVPPYGPANEIRFTAITKLKQLIPKANDFKLVNTELVEALFPLIEAALLPIASTPLPAILAAAAGALDSILPQIKAPVVDPTAGTISTQDLKINKLALRQLHPLLSQDDLPPWERLTLKNVLFLLFLDDFASTTANQVGFFRQYA
jgi:hypothetical protein